MLEQGAPAKALVALAWAPEALVSEPVAVERELAAQEPVALAQAQVAQEPVALAQAPAAHLRLP